MTQYLIPVSDEIIEEVAKAIARDRLQRDAENTLKDLAGSDIVTPNVFDNTLDRIFDKLWKNNSPANERQKDGYRDDARSAINAINLKLLISM